MEGCLQPERQHASIADAKTKIIWAENKGYAVTHLFDILLISDFDPDLIRG